MNDYTKFAQPWEQKTQVQTRIPVAANSQFFYAHNPENWELKMFDSTDKKSKKQIPVLLPVLSTMSETPGVNGTRAIGGNVDSTIMRTNLQNQGWTILNKKKHDYLTVYPAHKGNYHTSKWLTMEKVGMRIIEHFDNAGFDQWRLQLMQNGDLELPHPKIAELRLITMSRALSRLERDQHIPEVLARLKTKQTEYKNTKQAIERIKKLGKRAYEIQ